MTDIIERAELAIARGFVLPESLSLTCELVAELRSARAEIAEQKEWIGELTTSDE